MEGSSSLRGVGGGRSAQFVVKTYEMVDDSATDEIVSWSDTNNSFIVWNPTEFARLLLPSYFSHNNFNSFIRQLNTYGFRKIHEDRWEFANEDFVKGQKHILRKIHRRKPHRSHSVSHSHNTPPPPPPPQQVPTNNNVAVDPEKAALEEQIAKLSQEKATLESTISGFKQSLSAAELHLEELQSRMDAVEKRQNNLVNLFQTALQNPSFVEQISRKIDSNMDHLLLGGHNNKKKKRLPDPPPPPPPPQDVIDPVAENGSVDNNNNSSCSLIGMELGNIFDEDYLNKLISLELSSSPAAISSDINNLISTSNDDGESPHDEMMVVLSESGEPKEEVPLGFALDNDETLTFDDMDYSCFESPKLQCYYSCTTSEGGGGGDCNHLSCLLNQSLQQGSEYSPPIPSVPQMDIQESVESILLFHDDNDNEYYSNNIGGASSSSSNRNIDLANEVTTTTATGLASSVQEQEPSGGNNQGTLNAPAVSVLNDVFWEQFLTE